MVFEYLGQYSKFSSVEEMDEVINNRIKQERFNLTKSERAIVFAIKSHCLKYPGACHLKNVTIANEIGVSLITVSRAIKKLADLKIIARENKSKRNGIKGANIYYFLPQQNDVSDMMYQERDVEANDSKVSNEVSEECSIKSFNLLSSKQANNIISVGDELALQAEEKKEYMNEWQVTLFDFMHSLPMKDELKDELHKVVLSSEINDARDFVRAKDVLLNIIRDVNEGTLTISTTLRAVYKGAHSKFVERRDIMKVNTSSVEDKASNVRPVPFYNWLAERDGRPQYKSSKPTIENWLLW